MVMPKPDLTALTGGYRKTPVLQIDADIYCDSQLIMRELERRHPSPSLYPVGRGTADALSILGSVCAVTCREHSCHRVARCSTI